MDVEKNYRSEKEKAAMDREVRWYFRWSRIMFWWLTVMAVIATTCTVYSFSGPTSQRSLMASLESSSQFRPEPSESGSAVNSLLDKQQSSTIAPRSARVSEIPETSPALQSRESHNAVALGKRDWTPYERYSLAMYPVAVVGFAYGMWGLVDDCTEYHTDKETGATTKATDISGNKCVGNAIVTLLSLGGTVWGTQVWYAGFKSSTETWLRNQGLQIFSWGAPPTQKRDVTQHIKDVDPTFLSNFSDLLGYPVEHVGVHFHSWGSEDTNSTHPTHYSHVFNLQHPKGDLHFAYMGSDTEGHGYIKVGFGSGKNRPTNDHTLHARDKYYYLGQQTFTFGYGIMVKGITNPDNEMGDDPDQFNPDDEWDAMHSQVSCYLRKNSADDSGFSFQVYDNEYKSTGWAGAMSPFSPTHRSNIQNIPLGTGLETNSGCTSTG